MDRFVAPCLSPSAKAPQGPLTAQQEPDVKSIKVETEKLDASNALIAVTLEAHGGKPTKAADAVIRYVFVREAKGWKIDDMSGSLKG